MTPPPINIDGTDITGATIDGADVSEVTVDGTQVFGNVIPDSVEYQINSEDFADPWPFDVGNIDMTVTGLTQDTFSTGDTSVFADQTDSGTAGDGPETIPSNQQWSVFATVQYNAVDVSEFDSWFSAESSTSAEFKLRVSEDAQGNHGFLIDAVDDNGGDAFFRVRTDEGGFGDGNPHLCVITVDGGSNASDDVEIYVDDMITPVSTVVEFDTGFDHTNYNMDSSLSFFSDGGSAHVRGHSGTFGFADGFLSQTERESIKSRRPEV